MDRKPDELCLWETEDGEIAAILNQGDPGVCHLHIDPVRRTEALEDEMIAVAERECSAPGARSGRVVCVWSMEDDELRSRVLAERGYATFASEHSVEHEARRFLTEPIPAAPLPDGFVVRSMGDVGEHPQRSLCSWRAFHPSEPEEGCDGTGSWYRNVQRAPLYRRDLDVVAVAPNGDLASFAVCYYDDASRTGVFVLDGTAHEYQRRGLGRAVMTEALRRLQERGATAAYVSWYEAPAGALYRSVGFVIERRAHAWMRRL
ncbi:MAG: GNAT family N-acetyltransferase [Candidatus Bipolaricaulis sp.]|nr:GNAT family N-acetyltransferase [Candidatus Bipolaricaulis sp.]